MNLSIHNSTYIFILISFLSGYFEIIYILLLIIIIHEMGHALMGKLLLNTNANIIIYPFGGITSYCNNQNISIKNELSILLGGIVLQLLLYFIICELYKYSLITTHVYSLFTKIHYLLISFNFLPIIPLDGGRLINLLLDCFFSYNVSFIISIVISIIFIIIFTINNTSFYGIILLFFLLKSLYFEILNIGNRYYAFLFDRYKNNYVFKKLKIIEKINQFKRDCYHYINTTPESVILSKLFDTKG